MHESSQIDLVFTYESYRVNLALIEVPRSGVSIKPIFPVGYAPVEKSNPVNFFELVAIQQLTYLGRVVIHHSLELLVELGDLVFSLVFEDILLELVKYLVETVFGHLLKFLVDQHLDHIHALRAEVSKGEIDPVDQARILGSFLGLLEDRLPDQLKEFPKLVLGTDHPIFVAAIPLADGLLDFRDRNDFKLEVMRVAVEALVMVADRLSRGAIWAHADKPLLLFVNLAQRDHMHYILQIRRTSFAPENLASFPQLTPALLVDGWLLGLAVRALEFDFGMLVFLLLLFFLSVECIPLGSPLAAGGVLDLDLTVFLLAHLVQLCCLVGPDLLVIFQFQGVDYLLYPGPCYSLSLHSEELQVLTCFNREFQPELLSLHQVKKLKVATLGYLHPLDKILKRTDQLDSEGSCLDVLITALGDLREQGCIVLKSIREEHDCLKDSGYDYYNKEVVLAEPGIKIGHLNENELGKLLVLHFHVLFKNFAVLVAVRLAKQLFACQKEFIHLDCVPLS